MSEQDAPIVAETPELDLDLTEPPAPEPDEDDGLDDLEIGPEKYRVAKPIKEAWNGLQKTVQTEKETIKQREAQIAAREAALAENETARSALFEEIAEIKAIDKAQLAYKDMTPAKWVELSRTNPEAYAEHWAFYQANLAQREQLVRSANTKAQELDQKGRQTQAQRLAEAEAAIVAKIPDWTPAKREALAGVAATYGVSREIIADFLSSSPALAPAIATMLADLGVLQGARTRAAAAKAAAAKAAAEGAPIPEPVAAKVRGNTATITTLRDSDSDEVWLKKRNAQLSRRK